MSSWFRSALTDREGEFDTGRILVAIVAIWMCGIQGWDVMFNKHEFNAQSFGTGIGAVLVGFAAYLFGDRKPTSNPANANGR